MPLGTDSGKRRLLCEGWIEEGCESAAVCLPEFAYVTQGNKRWIAYGDRKRLEESVDGPMEIVESMSDLVLEERMLTTGAKVMLPKGGKWIVEGPAQRGDVKNANQRTYPKRIWEKLIGDKGSYVQKMIAERAMIGHLEHPKDGRTDLNESAILTVSSTLQEDGTVWNKFELLDTPKGLILQELTSKKVRWGTSSRGNGTVDDAGMVSESDYVLKTWDAVAAPSTPGAYTKLENKNTDEGTQVALSVRAKASLEALNVLVESECDGLDRDGRAKRADGLLRVLSSIDEATADELFQSGQGWAKVQQAIERSREMLGGVQASDRLDRAIEESLDSGETSEEQDGLLHVAESLQAQIAESVAENVTMRGRLEESESASRELQEVHEEALEQLSQVREELARTKRQHDLTCELLAEATARPDGDRRAEAKVDEMVAHRPSLKPYQNVLLEAARMGIADEWAERLDPKAPPKVEEPSSQVLANRSFLPVGIVESLDAPKRRSASAKTSEGASLAARAMSGAQKR